MAGRMVIPIENERGELVAYAGRSIDGSEPKYKLPAGFKKRAMLPTPSVPLKPPAEPAMVLTTAAEVIFRIVLLKPSAT